ncbi:ADP-ribosylglycohydrolase family protein [Kribbella sp. NPDC050124]|uniref:ADP-ribosylglycohydrolase family protein n=1 Tax=Kribbella sp. NPDC050124 TaxID=3364114 RepID=UPI0037B36162
MNRAAEETWRARIRGCLLGGAIGDALGAPVEFDSGRSIVAAHPDRLRTFVSGSAGWPPGTITDDTQMTLFTIEGLIRAGVRTDRGIGFTVAVVHHAYDRWLDTQTLPGPSGERDGWLQGEQWLYARRAPGNTCLSALTTARKGEPKIEQFGAPAENDSKGCGGVMRVAPFGLLPSTWFERDWVFDAAADAAGYTHGHPTGKLASGALAVIVREICEGADLNTALDAAAAVLTQRPRHEETSAALAAARKLAATAPGHGPVTVEQLGGGWVAEEALAIGVYAALAYPEPEQFLDALALSVTHTGDSDSTGAICGNILGALHGETALPPELVFAIEGRPVILELADDFALEFTKPSRLHGDYNPDRRWRTRYPGW